METKQKHIRPSHALRTTTFFFLLFLSTEAWTDSPQKPIPIKTDPVVQPNDDDVYWSALGSGIDGAVYAIMEKWGIVYAGGRFEKAGNVPANNIARWNGVKWSALGDGLSGTQEIYYWINMWAEPIGPWVHTITYYNNNIYAGGTFDGVDDNLAKWDGSTWSAVGQGFQFNGGGWDSFHSGKFWWYYDGVYDEVRCSTIYQNKLFVGGHFEYGLIAWDDKDLVPVGCDDEDAGHDVVDYPFIQVNAIAPVGNDLWMADFQLLGEEDEWGERPVYYFNIGKWDGTQWSFMKLGLTLKNDKLDDYPRIFTIHPFNGNIIIGGVFDRVAGIDAKNIARWDGTNWHAMGSGTDGTDQSGGAVYALASDDDYLYVGGAFENVDGMNINHIARWDGTQWSPMGSGTNATVYSIAVSGDRVYAGGYFTTAGGKPANRIARWTMGNVYTGFSQYAQKPLTADTGASMACSWGDYDNDGYNDLFIGNDGNGKNFLYHNNGDGSFAKVTNGTIVNDTGSSWSGAWGDYDNDGHLDLYVANTNTVNCLYHNMGDGTFEKITLDPAVSENNNSQSCSWCDLDCDGDLDLFVANAGGQNNNLFINNGDGSFTKKISGAIVTDGGSSVCGVWADYNRDGYSDLFVANKAGENNFLYRNNGDLTFTKVTSGDIVHDGGESWSGSWGDVNNDGFPDLFVANNGEANALYLNNGDGTFSKITEGEIVNDSFNTRSSGWGDCNNDGYLDLYISNRKQDNQLFINKGNGTFDKYVIGASNSRGVAWCDADIDGGLDLMIANDGMQNLLFINNGNQNNCLIVRCVGSESNKSGIGAKVWVESKGMRQLREVSSQSGFGGQNSLDVYFGVGSAAVVDTLRIEWPSGTVWDTTHVSANQMITIHEPGSSSTNVAEKTKKPDTFYLEQNHPNPFNPQTTIGYFLPEAAQVKVTIYSIKGEQIITLKDEQQSAGQHQIIWNSQDGSGKAVASGIYIYQIETPEYTQSRKMLLIR